MAIVTRKYINTVIIVILIVLIWEEGADYCGCKNIRPCYKKMLNDLLGEDEDPCIENVAIGTSTVTIFLKALSIYCDKIIKIYDNETTHEGKILYEVVISRSIDEEIEKANNMSKMKPAILLDAGQDAGSGPVGFALYIIEQLVACIENKDMIKNFFWIILPSTNPDGLEFARNSLGRWQKNYRPVTDMEAIGVDVTRNFDDFFGDCPYVANKFSQYYPGPAPNSENETRFIAHVMNRYRTGIKSYISFRRDGHGILYPYAARNYSLDNMQKTKIKAEEIAKKVNQRAGSIQWFVNQSIYGMNGKTHCGHSVDYAFNKLSVLYSFEMRIFPETDNSIMSKFQTLPKGYDVSLRAGYFSGIREIYNLLVLENNNENQ